MVLMFVPRVKDGLETMVVSTGHGRRLCVQQRSL